MVDSTSIKAEIVARRAASSTTEKGTAFLIFDTESIPDGRLVHRVNYPRENLTPEEAIARAQVEARELSATGSDFLPVTFQIPVALCVLRVANDFTLQALSALDAPEFRTEEMVRKFWQGVAYYRPKLVTFNGRGFDLPLLELAAFRQGISLGDYYQSSRNRFGGNHIDLCDWLSNFGAFRLSGGLNLLAKMLGKPGKIEVTGEQVYSLYLEGRLREINDYCMFDTLDTYFVFLRTRVLLGEMPLDRERMLVERARQWLTNLSKEMPVLRQYLDNWQEASISGAPEGR